jgi:hypothetical protein
MSIDPSLLSPVSALIGALIAGASSQLATIFRQRGQDRLQQVTGELAKREAVYTDFVVHASNLILHAYTHDEIALTGDEQRMIGLINQMRFFAPSKVVAAAEAVLRGILEISLKPRIELRQLAREALSKNLDPEPLLEFSVVCREDLDGLRQAAASRPRFHRVRRTGIGRPAVIHSAHC